ncbi:MAG: serine/threonine protein kinase, partial [Myxococcales bacterium]|nr:serine/threonine protein kinase [Myxococcales bacterium]
VQVYEVGESEGRTFVAMELVEGETLDLWIHRHPRPSWRECIEVFLGVGEGLAAAHGQGLIHRDFKPSNAIIDRSGRPRVLDFGLARRVDGGDDEPVVDEAPAEGRPELEVALTRTGAVLGTPAYMPPEQMLGGSASPRCDQFSFCVALYEALYGERPFEGLTTRLLLEAVRAGRLRAAPRGSRVPAAVRSIVARGLSFEPDARWPSMDALLERLRRRLVPRGRRLAVVGSLVVATSVGAALGVERYARWAHHCRGAEGELVGVWDEERRARVEDALLATRLPFAEDAWSRVEAELDDYSATWVQEHVDACEAATVRGEQGEDQMALRMACLGDRKHALAATVSVLAEADSQVTERAVELVSALPSLERCAEVERLATLDQRVPPPEDPAVADEVEALRGRLSGAKARWSAGRYEEARAEADAVRERAEALGYEPLLAEATLERGFARLRLGELDDAEHDLREAYASATRLDHPLVAGRAVAALVVLAGQLRSEHERGLQWGTTALALVQGPAAEPGAEARTLDAIGTVMAEKGELDRALEHHQRALALRERDGADELDLADSYLNIGIVQLEQGAVEEASGSFRRSAQLVERMLGPRHPTLAASLTNLGIALRRQGQPELALEQLRRAASIWEDAVGPDHLDTALVLNNIGLVLTELGRLDEALDHHRRAEAVFVRMLGPRHPNVAASLDNIGLIHTLRGEYEQAIASHQRALEIREEAFGPRHYAVGQLLLDLATALSAAGREQEARSSLQRACSILEEALGPEHSSLAQCLGALAEVELALGDAASARGHAERALAIREPGPGSGAGHEHLRFVLARALWDDPASRDRARALAQQARDGELARGAEGQEALAEIEAWLAREGEPPG